MVSLPAHSGLLGFVGAVVIVAARTRESLRRCLATPISEVAVRGRLYMRAAPVLIENRAYQGARGSCIQALCLCRGRGWARW